MRKVILQISMTLDGFTQGPNGELDWIVIDPEHWRHLIDLFKTTDTVLLGRSNYEGFGGYWPNVASNPASNKDDIEYSRWLDATPKIVFSRTLQEANWKNSRLIKGNAAEEIAKLKQQPGKDLVIMSSTGLAHSFMQEDLIDEYWLTIHPALLGDGVALFQTLTAKNKLRLLESRGFALGTVLLRYQTVREG